jgi:hypothetical protein
MRPSDTRGAKQPKQHLKDISEELLPEPGLPRPVIGSEEFVKVNKWQVNRVFGFLTGSTATCMAGVAAAPNLEVLGAAVAIWAGSVVLAMFLLAHAYRRPGQGHMPR